MSARPMKSFRASFKTEVILKDVENQSLYINLAIEQHHQLKKKAHELEWVREHFPGIAHHYPGMKE